MARGVYTALNIESGEEGSVFILIFQSIFLGIFFGTFDISAHALFLEVFDASMIPRAFLVSGVVGIIITSIYTLFQSRMRFSVFAVLNLFFVLVLTFLMRFGFTLTESNWHIFLVFVMMGPLNLIALLGFWGTVGRIYTLRQGKRLFGLIDTGQILGIILSSYAIPVMLSMHVETRDLIYISACAVLVALLFQIIISSRYKLDQQVETAETQRASETEASSQGGVATMFKSRYIRYMSMFAVLMISVTMFVHFSFMGVTQENYPDHGALAAFLGYFNGTLMIFSVLIKTFVYGRLMKTWGLKLALLIAPALILIFTIIASIIGGVFGLAASFTMFFLIISITKLFSKSLQDSIVAPSMKILYQSLDASIRYNIQARIDGTVNEISVLVSSLIASGLVALSFFGLVHYTYVLLFLLVVWGYFAFRLYQEYKHSLNASLAQFQQSDAAIRERDIYRLLDEQLHHDSESQVGRALGMIERIDFGGFLKALSALMKSASGSIRKLSLDRIDDLNIPLALGDLKESLDQEKSKENKDTVRRLLERRKEYLQQIPSPEELLLHSKSVRKEERLMAAMQLFEIKDFQHHAVLSTLLRDPDTMIRAAAIQAAAFWKQADTVPVLIDLLDSPHYKQSFDALVQMGEVAIESLEQAYFKSGIRQITLNRITRVLGSIGEPAIPSLTAKMIDQNAEVQQIAINGLLALDFRADEQVMPRIIDRVKTTIQQMAWNMAAVSTAETNEMSGALQHQLNEEVKYAADCLYNLLSLAYDANSIHHIRENLESGTSEGIGFAIELMDLFIAEEIKPVLFPLLEDTGTVEKIRRLQSEFPVEILPPYELLISIINRDPNLTSTVTKAAAIAELSDIQDVEISDDLLAQVFNADELLSELAALQAQGLDPGRFSEVSMRLPSEQRQRLSKVVRDAEEGWETLIWDGMKVIRSNPVFGTLQSNVIYGLAREMNWVHLLPGQEFRLHEKGTDPGVALVKSGSAVLMVNGQQIESIGENQLAGVLPFTIAGKDVVALQSSDTAIVLTITQARLDELMFDHESLAKVVYNWVAEKEEAWTNLSKDAG